MRLHNVAALVTAVALVGCPGVAAASPPPKCADAKGIDMGQTCQIQISDPAYTVNISFPTDYPDEKSLIDYVTQTRDGFLNVAKMPVSRDLPYQLDITATDYGSAIPPRGTQTVVLKTFQDIGDGHPETSYKAFNWDQGLRKPITYDTLWQPGAQPLNVVFPIVQTTLQEQTAQQQPIAPTVGLDPTNYQNFAVTNDGVIFFFSQGQLLPAAAGATQVTVPRSAIDPMLA